MKKAHFSPVTSLVLSFSLAFGILVSDISGFKFLTAAQARNDSQQGCGTSVDISEGVALNGIAVRGLLVNGEVVSYGLIAGSVRIVDSTVSNVCGVDGDITLVTDGVIVGDTVTTIPGGTTNGVIVGDTAPTTPGATTNGVIVGDTLTTSVVTNSGDIFIVGTEAEGGSLTGDGIEVIDGVITGQNLLLSGTSFEGGSAVQVSPAN